MANPSPKLENLSNKGKGRAKGSKNKFTELKEAYLKAFENIGGIEDLTKLAKNPRYKLAFYQMLSKMLPREEKIEHGGEVVHGVTVYVPKRPGMDGDD